MDPCEQSHEGGTYNHRQDGRGLKLTFIWSGYFFRHKALIKQFLLLVI